jgi:uncharacterized protein (TIGR03067 family)
MSAGETQPTPPAPLPEGRGEKEGAGPETLNSAQEAPPSLSPLPSGRGAGGVGSSGAWPAARARLIAFALIGLVGFAVWYFAFRTREARDDAGRFQGEWQLAVPATGRDGAPAARPKPVTVRVKGDRWVFLVGDTEQKRYTAVLRPGADPKEIDLTLLGPDDKPRMAPRDGKPAPVVIRGIYVIEQNRAKVAVAPDPEPRPAKFDDAEPAGVWLLERTK